MDSPGRSFRVIIAFNTLYQLLGKGISVVVIFITTLLIARYFGANGFGDYSKITTFVSFYFIFSDFGLNAVALQHAERKYIWDQLLGLRFIISVFLCLLAIFVLFIIPTGEGYGFTLQVRLGIMFFLPAIIFQGFTTSANAIFQQKHQYNLSFVAVSVGMFCILAGTYISVLFFFGYKGIYAVVFSSLLGSIITSLLSYIFVQKNFSSFSFHFSKNLIKMLFIKSIPLGITLVLNQVYFRADSFILALTRSTEEVGYYGLAFKVFEAAIVLPTFFMNTLYPYLIIRVNNLTQSKNQQFFPFYYKSLVLLFVGSLVMASALWIFAPLFSKVHSEFIASIPALRILALGIPFFYITSLYMWVTIALNKNYILPWVYGIAMCITVFSNIHFIPKYGYIAAAWVTVASEIFVFLVMTVIVLKLIRVYKK